MTQTRLPTLVDPLTDYRVFLHLSPFLAQECTLSEAAKTLGISTQRMSYWVNKLMKFDLIRFVRFQKSARHQAAVYRSKQDSYVIPLSAVNESHARMFQRALQDQNFECLQQSIARNFSQHAKTAQLRLWRDSGGARFLVENPNNPDDFFGFTSHFTSLWLEQSEINALHAELRALHTRYRALSDRSKSKTALLYCGLVDNPVLSGVQ
jgi:hypothetical protein